MASQTNLFNAGTQLQTIEEGNIIDVTNSSNSSTAVQTTQNNLLDSIPDPTVLAEYAEKIRKSKEASLKAVNPKNLVLFGNTVFIDNIGCEALGRLWGINVEANTDKDGNLGYKKTVINEETGEFMVEITGTGYFINNPNIKKVYIGTCESSNRLLNIEHKGDPSLYGQVKISSVVKRARNNLIHTAITKMLGLDITIEDLKNLGIDTSKCTSVDFKDNKGKKQTTEEADLGKQLWNWLLEMAGGDAQEASARLGNITEFKGKEGETVKGITDYTKLNGKRLQITHGKVKKFYEEYQADIS